MAALAIVRRDLVRYARNPVRTALLFSMPLMLAGIFALVFGGGGSEQISIRVLLHDEDDSLLAKLLEGAGGSSEMDQQLEIIPVDEEGYEMMERGEASALIHLPDDFTRDYLAGRPTTIDVIKNPSERFLPKVVEEGALIGAVALSAGSRVFRDELAQIGGFVDSEAFPADPAVASVSTGFNQKLKHLEQYLMPPAIDFETVTLIEVSEEEAEEGFNILAYFLPGFSIMGILFLAQSATRDILRDREMGLIRHLLTAPVSTGDYVRGKSLSVLLVTGLGFAVFVAIGVAAGVNWGFAPAAAALMLSSAVMASGVLLFIAGFVDSERQADTLTTIVIMVFSMLGGAFVPISQMPAFLRPLAAATPVYWSVDGFTKLTIGAGGFAEISTHLMVLLVVGAACLIAGSSMLRRKLERGAV